MKFKKNIALFFTCYYLIISVGLTITLHFCGGNLASIAAFTSEIVCEDDVAVDVCCAETKTIDEGCCDDEIIDFSEAEEEAVIQSLDYPSLLVAILPDFNFNFSSRVKFQNKTALPNYTFQSNAPPLYKLYGTYIHYA